MEARASPCAPCAGIFYFKTTIIKMKTRNLLLALAALSLSAACDSGTPATPETTSGPIPAGTVAVVLQTTSEPEKRTALENSENVQHVAYMHLYVFAGTSDDAVCVASENVGWNQPAGTSAKQYYLLRTPLPALPQGETKYTFLAVGLDNTAEEIAGTAAATEGSAYAYGLPGTITTAADGQASTLAEAEASLADERTAADMGSAELFSGSSQIEPQKLNSPVGIELKRKVAGVALFVTNIPEKVKDTQLSNDSVETLEVRLYTEQNTTVSLLSGEDSPISDSPATDGQTLISLPKEMFQPQGVTTGGAYLLPVDAPAQAATATLTLRLLNAAGEVLAERQVQEKAADNGTPVLNFALQANHYYGIGSMGSPVDLNDGKNTAEIIVHPNWEAIYGESRDDAITIQPDSPKP